MESVADIFGWIGAGSLLVSFLLTTYHYIKPQEHWYTLLNLLGAIGIGTNAFYHGAYPSVTLEIIWAIVAIGGFVLYLKKTRARTEQ